MEQQEFEEPVDILNEQGQPVNPGWARSPVMHYNESRIWTSQRYDTFSDKYVVFSNSFMFVFELRDNGIFGFLNVTAVSLLDKHALSKRIHVFFPMGTMELGSTANSETVRFFFNHNLLEFIVMEQGIRIIKVDIPQIGHNRRLRGELVLIAPPAAQSMYVHSSWPAENRRFRFLHCSPWWPVEGVMQFENTDLPFYKDRAWGIFYWNRMVRPKTDLRYWAAGSGLQDGRQISFNLGYGTDDNRHGTENAFFINGILHKLELVTFHFSPSAALNLWTFTSNNNYLRMTFLPLQEQWHRNSFLFHTDTIHQIYGFFSGSLVLDDGTVFQFNKITGIIERRKTRS